MSKTDKQDNVMRNIKIDKVTLNIGAGTEQENVEKAITLLTRITNKKPVKTISKKRIPTWNLRPGLPIGAKITIRGKEAEAILTRMLKAVEFKLRESCFSPNGFSFGIKEYIDVEGLKYDPKMGIIGFDVIVTLKRQGYRVKIRKVKQSYVALKHKITREDSRKFAMDVLGVKLEDEE